MEQEVSDHKPDKGFGAFTNIAVCGLKPCKDCKSKKVEGSCCGSLKISDTLAEENSLCLSGSNVLKPHNFRSQEDRISTYHAQNQKRQFF